MVIICRNIFKAVIQVIAKFAFSLHFLLLISFMFLHFLPGSFIEDEFIVADKNLGEKNFFFEFKKYLSNVYHFNLGSSYAHPQTTVIEIISERYLTSIKLIVYSFAFILVSSLVLSTTPK
jgi:ABC-type dipeptide/oligopeptide/nickel transport system permease component